MSIEVMKPCPFDGNQPEMKHKDGSCGYSPGQYYISCGCGCSSPKFDDEKWTKRKGTISISNEAKQSALLWWNRRNPVSVKDIHEGAPPETHKPWVGLTPEDYDSMRPRVPDIVNDFSFADVAAIVEAKLKEKNT